MDSNVDAVGLQRDLMSLNEDPTERFSCHVRLEESLAIPAGAVHLGIAPPSRSPSSSPSVSSSDTGEDEEDGDEDAPYGYAEDGESGGKHGRDDKLWLRLATGEERRQLLGTEEESSDRHSSGGEDDAADDEDDSSNIWAINGEQQSYYEEQFGKLNKDPSGFLSGLEARKFFEKSGLPMSDLSAIWQLSDVTQDGKLDKAEFFTAMHLVVLRRHGIDVPEVLPPSLHPSRILLLKNLEWTKFEEEGKEKARRKERRRPKSPPPPSCTPPPLPSSFSPPLLDLESSSPLPANFDFHRSPVDQDPRIKHPKAVRVTPDLSNYPSGMGELKATQPAATHITPGAEGLLLQPVPQPRQESHVSQSHQHHRMRVDASDIKGIQRPTPRKTRPHIRPIGSGVPTLPPPDEISGGPASLPPTLAGAPPPAPPPPLLHHQKAGSSVTTVNTNPMPPPPPPRVPIRSHHTRSSSLDLNKLDRESPTAMGPSNGRGIGHLNQSQQPPAVPPRSSPAPAVKPRGHTLAGPNDGRALAALMTSSLIVNDARPSAFREYKRPGSNEEEVADHSPASMTRSLRVLNWEEERKEMKDRVTALLARLPLQNDEATREEVSAAVKWLQERRLAINSEIAELQSELSFLVASRQVLEQSPVQKSSPLDA